MGNDLGLSRGDLAVRKMPLMRRETSMTDSTYDCLLGRKDRVVKGIAIKRNGRDVYLVESDEENRHHKATMCKFRTRRWRGGKKVLTQTRERA